MRYEDGRNQRDGEPGEGEGAPRGVCRFCHVDSTGWSVITVVSVELNPLPIVAVYIPRCARNPVKMQIPVVSPSSGREEERTTYARGRI